MLLVHHHQAEAAEADPLGEEGVGPHRNRRRPGGEVRLHRAPLAGGEGGDEELHPQPQGLGQGAHRGEVLAGEELGGHQQGRLLAVLYRPQTGQQRHQGLARADVTLEQPPHGGSAAQVILDLRHRPLLGAGEGEGEGGDQARSEGRRGAVGRPPLGGPLLAGPQQRELEEVELLEDQAVVVRGAEGVETVEVGVRRRAVEAEEGVGAADQPLGHAHRRGQRVGGLAGVVAGEVEEELAQGPLGDATGEGVDRANAPQVGAGDAVAELMLRVDHHHSGRPAAYEVDAAVDHDRGSVGELPAQIGLVVPAHREGAARVHHLALEVSLDPPAPLGHPPLGDDPGHRRHHGRAGLARWGEGAPVLVAQGEVGQGVADGRDGEAQKRRDHARADPRDLRDGGGEGVDG